jgi:hypothetical protein
VKLKVMMASTVVTTAHYAVKTVLPVVALAVLLEMTNGDSHCSMAVKW